MSTIVNYYKNKVYQTGRTSFVITVVSSTNYAGVTAAGFLNQAVLTGLVVTADDVVIVTTSDGEQATFTPSIDSNGIITLEPANTADFISGDVVEGHVAVFTDDNRIEDGGNLGTAAYKASSDDAMDTVAAVSEAKAISLGAVAVFTDIAGTVGKNTAYYKAKRSPTVTGASFTVTDADVTTTSIITANFEFQAAPATILTISPGSGSFVVTCSADPGTSGIMYTAQVSQS